MGDDLRHMITPESDELSDRLANLRRKADQQCTAHAWLRDRYALIHSAFSTLSLVTGVALLAIVMASPTLVAQTTGLNPGQFQWLTAFVAAFSFSIVVVLLAWRPDAKAERHDQAVRHYTRIGYRASRSRIGPTPLTLDFVVKIEEEYLDERDLPRIPENRFLQLKQWHLQKVAQSKALDHDPFLDLATFRPGSQPSTADLPASAPAQSSEDGTRMGN